MKNPKHWFLSTNIQYDDWLKFAYEPNSDWSFLIQAVMLGCVHTLIQFCRGLPDTVVCCQGINSVAVAKEWGGLFSHFLVCSIELASRGSMTPANKTYFTFSALSFQVPVLQQCLRALRDELCLLALMWHEWLMLLRGKLHSESSDTLNQFL